MDRNIHTFKAQLATNGYAQTQEIDYKETFLEVKMIKSIRIMFAIVAFLDHTI